MHSTWVTTRAVAAPPCRVARVLVRKPLGNGAGCLIGLQRLAQFAPERVRQNGFCSARRRTATQKRNDSDALWGAEQTTTNNQIPSWRAEDRFRLRQLQSQPILEKLQNYLSEIHGEVLPKSPEGRAVRYTLKNWIALTRYCKDGDLQIDNNATERAIRGVAVGRKNWVFFGNDAGGKTAALLRSFVASCQRVGVDPFAWLQNILSPHRRSSHHPARRTSAAQLGSRTGLTHTSRTRRDSFVADSSW